MGQLAPCLFQSSRAVPDQRGHSAPAPAAASESARCSSCANWWTSPAFRWEIALRVMPPSIEDSASLDVSVQLYSVPADATTWRLGAGYRLH